MLSILQFGFQKETGVPQALYTAKLVLQHLLNQGIPPIQSFVDQCGSRQTGRNTKSEKLPNTRDKSGDGDDDKHEGNYKHSMGGLKGVPTGERSTTGRFPVTNYIHHIHGLSNKDVECKADASNTGATQHTRLCG